jgi:hypothetical protein
MVRGAIWYLPVDFMLLNPLRIRLQVHTVLQRPPTQQSDVSGITCACWWGRLRIVISTVDIFEVKQAGTLKLISVRQWPCGGVAVRSLK